MATKKKSGDAVGENLPPALPAEAEKEKQTRTLTAKELTEEENMKFTAHAMGALVYPTVDLYDEDAVFQRLRLYIASCNRNNLRPTPPGLASWLGISAEELREWMLDRGTVEHRSIAVRVYEMLRSSWADYALTGKTPASVAIFVAKNWFAMSDAARVSDAPQVQKQLDLEKLAAEAAALPDTEIIDADYSG